MKKISKLFPLILGLFATSLAIFPTFREKEYVAVLGYTNNDGATYYNGINSSLDGEALLDSLRDLNYRKRQSQVGYNSMVNYFGQTDKENGYILSFYSGNRITRNSDITREHVWPNSHGGDLVEDDIHMVRPCLKSENNSRGNSFFVEGMATEYDGWDPGAVEFGDFTYRGDAARIIFYCVVACDEFELLDVDKNHTTSQNNDNKMGKLSDLLKWNALYAVANREKIRNEAAEKLQGNRNPFIDHPEYACKIWGKYNEKTDAVCKQYDPLYEAVPLQGISFQENEVTISKGQYYNLTVNYNPENATNKNLSWESSDTRIVAIADSTGKIYARGVGQATKKKKSEEGRYIATCVVHVQETPVQPAASAGGGCGGNIIATSITLSVLSFGGLLLLFIIKKKRVPYRK